MSNESHSDPTNSDRVGRKRQIPGRVLRSVAQQVSRGHEHPIFMCRRSKVKPWKLYKTFNTIGALLTVGFATLSAVSLQPLMCYHHPNGKSSLVKYTGTFCGDHEQIIMVAVGMVSWQRSGPGGPAAYGMFRSQQFRD